MKSLFAIAAMIALLGFVGFTHAADDTTTKKPVMHRGVVIVKIDTSELTYKGTRANSKEHTIKVNDSTKVTLEGKDAKLSDLKADLYATITDQDGTATKIVASAEAPKRTATTKPSN